MRSTRPRLPSGAIGSRVTIGALAAFAAIAAGALGCGAAAATGSGAAATGNGATHAPDPAETAARVKAFDADETRVLDEIAASDPRFALRAGTLPSDASVRRSAVNALLEEDPDAMVHEGSLDFFSFAARTRGLDRAQSIVSAMSASALPEPANLERTLLARTLVEERARLDDERDLPRGASDLVRGIIDTWGPPESLDAVKARDTWVARRLDAVRASLAKSALPRVELIELDDALDPLERLASPSDFPGAAGALANLRVALGNVKPPPSREPDFARLDRGVRAHLGYALTPAEMRARLERAAAALRTRIDARMTRAQRADDRALMNQAEALVLAPGRCEAKRDASRIRALAPPPERAPICGALHFLDGAKSDDALLITLVALHFDVTAALWSLAIHEAALDPDRAAERIRPILPIPPEREVRWLRVATAHPVLPIAAGLAADLLTRDPDADLREAAHRWIAFGDAPLDVVEAQLFGRSESEKMQQEGAKARRRE